MALPVLAGEHVKTESYNPEGAKVVLEEVILGGYRW